MALCLPTVTNFQNSASKIESPTFKCTRKLQLKGKYSSVPNKRPGWNKRIGRGKSYNLINVLDGINVLVG